MASVITLMAHVKTIFGRCSSSLESRGVVCVQCHICFEVDTILVWFLGQTFLSRLTEIISISISKDAETLFVMQFWVVHDLVLFLPMSFALSMNYKCYALPNGVKMFVELYITYRWLCFITDWKDSFHLNVPYAQFTDLSRIQSNIWGVQRAKKLQEKRPTDSWLTRWGQISTWWSSCQTYHWKDQQQFRRKRTQRKSWMILWYRTNHAHTPDQTIGK